MNYFRVLIHGQNFQIEQDGQIRTQGFFATRFVEAKDHDEAESLAVATLRDLESLREKVRNPEQDRPELVIEETQPLDSLDGISQLQPNLAWYDPAPPSSANTN